MSKIPTTTIASKVIYHLESQSNRAWQLWVVFVANQDTIVSVKDVYRTFVSSIQSTGSYLVTSYLALVLIESTSSVDLFIYIYVF